MHRGYIKLWRKIQDWDWFNDSKTLHVWIYLLIKCNHKDTFYKGYPVPRGSCITGLNAISEHTHMSVRSARTCLTHLKMTNNIAVKATNKFSIVSIIEYENYQGDTPSKLTDKKTFDRQTTDKQLTASKEREALKHLKKEEVFCSPTPEWKELKEKMRKIGKEIPSTVNGEYGK